MPRSRVAVEEINARTPTVKCPSCGYGAGIYRLSAEDRIPATPVRCLSCGHDALIDEWRGSDSNG